MQGFATKPVHDPWISAARTRAATSVGRKGGTATSPSEIVSVACRTEAARTSETPHRKECTLSRKRIRNTVVAGTATLALGAGMFAGLGPVATFASSHREAPLTSADPQIDNTDVYAFVSPDDAKKVTFVSSWIPFEEPAGGPNFYNWAEHTNYDINISNDGDARAEIVYRWRFKTHYRNANSFIYNNGPVTSLNDENLLIYQTYDLLRIKNGNSKKILTREPVAPSNVGDASMPDYNSDLFDAAVVAGRQRSRAGSGSPTTRSSWTFVCSTCSTAGTSPRPAMTRWRAST